LIDLVLSLGQGELELDKLLLDVKRSFWVSVRSIIFTTRGGVAQPATKLTE
jgi:hypothetical protein